MDILPPLFTGLGLFFCGVTFIAANLTPLLGGPARRLLRQAVSADWRAAFAGVLAGLATQSTNAVSLVVVGFVRAGIIPEERAALLPAWSHVGAAALVILVSLQTNVAVAYALALAGAALYFNVNLGEKLRHAVLVLLGAGMLFLGMQMLKLASDPLRAWLVGHGLVGHNAAGPALPLALGLALAVVTQSSTVAGAMAVALVRVQVFDLDAALFLLAGANGGSALNYALLGRKGEAVGRHVLLFQAAQKLFGTAGLIILLAGFGGQIGAAASAVTTDPATQLAWLFLATQLIGSLSCTLARKPIAALLRRIAPPGEEEALSKPAFLLHEALSDPPLALDLVTREQLRLLERLPRMLEEVRSEGARGGPSAEQLRHAGQSVGEATRRYLASILEGRPGRDAVVRAMRLQRALDNIVALHESLGDFVVAAHATEGAAGDSTVGHMVESAHMLLGVLADLAACDDAEEQQLSLMLLGERGDVIEAMRTRLMAAAPNAPAKVQEALFRSTFLFERVLWLAHDTAQAFAHQPERARSDKPATAATETITIAPEVVHPAVEPS